MCCWAGARPLPSTSGGSGHNAQAVGGEGGRRAGPQSAILTWAGDTCSTCSPSLRQRRTPLRGLTARVLRSSPAGPSIATAGQGAALLRQRRARPGLKTDQTDQIQISQFEMIHTHRRYRSPALGPQTDQNHRSDPSKNQAPHIGPSDMIQIKNDPPKCCHNKKWPDHRSQIKKRFLATI